MFRAGMLKILLTTSASNASRSGSPVTAAIGPAGYRWSRVLVSGTARKAEERAVLGSRHHPCRAPGRGPVRVRGRDRSEDRTIRAAFPPHGCAAGEAGDRRPKSTGMARGRHRPVARVHLLLAGVGGALPAPTAEARRRPATGPAPKKASRQPGRWPSHRSGCTRCGGLPSQDGEYGLFLVMQIRPPSATK
jgi:hypothetical protein